MSPADSNAAPAHIDCIDFVELVTEYVEGTLSDVDRARFDAHMDLCPPCRVYLEQMEQTRRALGQLAPATLAPRARQELLTLYRRWRDVDGSPAAS